MLGFKIRRWTRCSECLRNDRGVSIELVHHFVQRLENNRYRLHKKLALYAKSQVLYSSYYLYYVIFSMVTVYANANTLLFLGWPFSKIVIKTHVVAL